MNWAALAPLVSVALLMYVVLTRPPRTAMAILLIVASAFVVWVLLLYLLITGIRSRRQPQEPVVFQPLKMTEADQQHMLDREVLVHHVIGGQQVPAIRIDAQGRQDRLSYEEALAQRRAAGIYPAMPKPIPPMPRPPQPPPEAP